MEWVDKYDADKMPSEKQISDFINSPLWEDLNEFLKAGYEVAPAYSYSICSAQPGWNIKYKKAGKALCTLYPMEGYFIALVVIGNKEIEETELVLPELSEKIKEMLDKTVPLMGGRWLMIDVTDNKSLDDVKRLIQIRRKIKKKA